jgi:small subunit ribosomal protein S16
MVRIRLMRVGKRKQPSYRVVVADSRSPRDGRIIEAIGHYHPRQEPSEVVIDTDRAQFWIDRGAQPSDQVRKLLSIASSPGEAATTPEAPKKTTKVKATPAASVAEEAREDDESGAAELPEAVDQAAAAPEASSGEVPGSEAADGGDEQA